MNKLNEKDRIEILLENFRKFSQNDTTENLQSKLKCYKHELGKVLLYLKNSDDCCLWKSFVNHDCIRMFISLLNNLRQLLF